MKLTSTYTVTCYKNCGFTFSDESEHVVLEKMFNHVRYHHPKLYRQLQKEGRRRAMSQNGLGYFDDGNSTSAKAGWHMAAPHFRRAWTRTALQAMLQSTQL